MKEDDIIIKASETGLQTCYSDFSLSLYLESIMEAERSNLVDNVCAAAQINNVYSIFENAKALKVVIPDGLKDALRQGKAVFGASSKTPGQFTPNIYVDGQKGVQGQVTLTEGADSAKINAGIANLAMYAMIANISRQLDAVEKKVDALMQGQQDDRKARVIGAFRAYALRLKDYKTVEERRCAAQIAYNDMSIGLMQIYSYLIGQYNELQTAPKNDWEVIKRYFFDFVNIGTNKTEKYRQQYLKFEEELHLFFRLLLLTDAVLMDVDTEEDVIEANHADFSRLLQGILSGDFIQRMEYTHNCELPRIKQIQQKHKEALKLLHSFDKENMYLEIKNKEK